MKREFKLKLSVFEKLSNVLDEEMELFIQERPWLIDPSFIQDDGSVEIIDLSEYSKLLEVKEQALLRQLLA